MKKHLKKTFLVVTALAIVFSAVEFTPVVQEMEAKLALSSITQTFASNEYQARMSETPPSALQLKENESLAVVAKFENLGETPWYKDFSQNSSVSLVASRHYNRQSVFYDKNTWKNPGTILMQETKVEQGETAIFSFNLNAPYQSETYREYFQLTANDGSYLGPEFYIDVQVGESNGEVLGAAAESTSASEYQSYLDRQDLANYDAEFVAQASFPSVEQGEVADFYFKFKNTGKVTWFNEGENAIYLTASNPDGRESKFTNNSWENSHQIAMAEEEVAPGETATFTFELDTNGVDENVYREYFALEVSKVGMIDETYGTYLNIKVGNSEYSFADLEGAVASTFAGREKEIWVNLQDQMAYMVEDGEIIFEMRTSTGRPGMATPQGDFPIMRKTERHWSHTYKLWMPYAMQFTKQGHYLHALPVWPNGYEEGRDHLGWAISHGCVRLEHPDKLFYWAEVGTLIKIRQTFEELQNG
ncbi:MAG: L,D-transpeptidase family protein [Candidatus Gracilibacteria bacterium]|nr:L,D-transpeptidase family protein [Candidatus Gracilibacteria bacterium]